MEHRVLNSLMPIKSISSMDFMAQCLFANKCSGGTPSRFSPATAVRRDRHKSEQLSVIPGCIGQPRIKKERCALYEVNQTAVSHGPDAGGASCRRLGANLGFKLTASIEEA
jgi:hypothetical protein